MDIDVSVIIAAVDEVNSLAQTVRVLVDESCPAVKEIVLVTSPESTPACRAVCIELQAAYPQLENASKTQSVRRVLGVSG